MATRDATTDDLSALAGLEQLLFGPDAWSAEALAGELSAAGRTVLVHEQDGAVVGYVVTIRAGDVVDVARIGVHPDRQRAGLARGLLAAAIAAGTGVDRVLLEVAASNRAALAFYADAGFTQIDLRPRYYRDGADAIVMRRSLAAGCGGSA